MYESESQDLLTVLNHKYKNEQKALFDNMFGDWTLGNGELDSILHHYESFHGLDAGQVQAVKDDFAKLVRTHEQESKDNFENTDAPEDAKQLV